MQNKVVYGAVLFVFLLINAETYLSIPYLPLVFLSKPAA